MAELDISRPVKTKACRDEEVKVDERENPADLANALGAGVKRAVLQVRTIHASFFVASESKFRGLVNKAFFFSAAACSSSRAVAS